MCWAFRGCLSCCATRGSCDSSGCLAGLRQLRCPVHIRKGTCRFRSCRCGNRCTRMGTTVERKLYSCEENLLVVKSFPRTRGVDPNTGDAPMVAPIFSPHSRGCSVDTRSTTFGYSFPRSCGVTMVSSPMARMFYSKDTSQRINPPLHSGGFIRCVFKHSFYCT